MEPTTDDRSIEQEHERTKSWTTWAIVVAPAVVLIGLLAWGFLVPSRTPERRAPDFELRLLGGGTLSSAELRGNPVVLNFWASWCIPCREEMPAFERMWQRYQDRGVQIIGVNYQDSPAGARDFVTKVDVTYPIALDPNGSLASTLGVRGLPQTFFIDEDFRFEKLSVGEAVEGSGERVVFGAIDEETLEKKIEELLEE